MDSTHEGRETRDPAAIREWLIARLSALIRCPADQIDVDASFDRLGLDSATAVGVTLDLEDWLERTIEPSILYDFPSIRALAEELARTEPR